MAKKLELGKKYRDTITGIEGACTGIAEYLTGCTQGLLEHRNDSGSANAVWFDIDRLELLKQPRLMHRVEKAGAGPLPPMSRAAR